MSMTLQDMATAVLEELGVLASGSAPSAEDAAKVKAIYKQWRRTAEKRTIIDWYSDDEDIPDGAERGVVLCVCPHVCRSFGVAVDGSWMIEGEMLLSDYMADIYPHASTPGVFF